MAQTQRSNGYSSISSINQSPSSSLVRNASFLGPKFLWRGGALFILCGIMADTFGTHILKNSSMPPNKVEVWSTASRFAIYNGLGLLAVSLHPRFSVKPFAGPAILFGGIVFSGTLFWRSCSDQFPIIRKLAPVGGMAMMAGYLSLIF